MHNTFSKTCAIFSFWWAHLSFLLSSRVVCVSKNKSIKLAPSTKLEKNRLPPTWTIWAVCRAFINYSQTSSTHSQQYKVLNTSQHFRYLTSHTRTSIKIIIPKAKALRFSLFLMFYASSTCKMHKCFITPIGLRYNIQMIHIGTM